MPNLLDDAPHDKDSNRSVLQNGVRALNGILNAMQNSYLFGAENITVGVSTVAGLPTNPTQGMRRTVTDANSTTFHAVVAGGGTNVVPIYYDGSVWRIG